MSSLRRFEIAAAALATFVAVYLLRYFFEPSQYWDTSKALYLA